MTHSSNSIGSEFTGDCCGNDDGNGNDDGGGGGGVIDDILRMSFVAEELGT